MSIPSTFQRLVDDAAIFPPGLAPLPEAVRAHAEHRAGQHAALVGPLVIDLARLDALASLDTEGLEVSVVVPDPQQVTAAVETLGRLDISLAALEVKLGGAGLAGVDVASQVAQIVESAPTGLPVYVEVPRPSDPAWQDALAAVTSRGLRLKFRTGGTEAAAFPTEDDVASWIFDSVRNGVAFKCTAGLHHAIRHTAANTGFEHHGYLNILLATAHALAGADQLALVGVLAERSADAVAVAVRTHPNLADARNSFVSYGSCSVTEPYQDLIDLDLVEPQHIEEHPA